MCTSFRDESHVGLFFGNKGVDTVVESGVWVVWAKCDGTLSCWIYHTYDCHFLGPSQQTASQRNLSTCKQQGRFTVLLSFQHFCSIYDSKTLVTFCRCAIIFQVVESLTTLCMAYGLSKSSLNRKLWYPLYLLLRESWYTRSSLEHHKYDMCHKHYSLLVMTAVRSCWLRICRNTSQHDPKKSCCSGYNRNKQVWTLFIRPCTLIISCSFTDIMCGLHFRLQPHESNDSDTYTTVETVYLYFTFQCAVILPSCLLVMSQIMNAVSSYQDSMVNPGSLVGLMAVYCILLLQDSSQSAPEPFQHAL